MKVPQMQCVYSSFAPPVETHAEFSVIYAPINQN